jgi:hypothetical protein
MLAVCIAVVLNLPWVSSGWYLDDLFHRAQFLGVGPFADSSNMTHRMFDFLSGDAADILELKDLGLPWWADDQLKIRFWRPLSSFTHVIDYALWPESGLLMHLHSVAWFACLVWLLALLYRRLIAVPQIAGLAVILYALDDAHGMPVAFLANRNAIVATTFGVLSVWMHDRWRRDGWSPGAWLSPLAFLAALLGGESGSGIAAYLLSYALFLERRTGIARLVPILPHAIVGIAWLAVYTHNGYGTSGTSFYTDPFGQPGEWLSVVPIRATLLLTGQWFMPPSGLAVLMTPAQTLGVAVFGVVVLTALLRSLRPMLRADPTARFLAFGMVLAVIPITATEPNDRLLFFVGIGAMPLLAMLLVRLFDRSLTSGVGRSCGWILVVLHVVVAAPMQLFGNASLALTEPFIARAPRSLPGDDDLATQQLVILNHPAAFFGTNTLHVRAFDSRTVPQSMLMLAPGTSSLIIERRSARMLAIEAEGEWLGSPFDVVYRDRSRPFPADYRVDLSGVRIQVEALTDDGQPRKVLFTFERELEDDSLRWVRYVDGDYVPFDVPAVGETTMVGAVPFSLLSPPAPRPTESR